MIVPDQALWAIPLVFYLTGNCCLLKPTEFLLFEDAQLRWRASLASAPFVWRFRVMYLLNPLTPFACILRVPWSAEEDNSSSKARLRGVSELSYAAAPVRILSALSFLNLFVLAPSMTAFTDLSHALAIVVPAHLLMSTATLFVMRRRRSPLQKIATVLEYIVCPGLLPNACRRYSLSLRVGHRPWEQVIGHLTTKDDLDRFNQARDLLIAEHLYDQPGDIRNE